MEWVLVALIIGVMVYAGIIVVEYTNCSIHTQPRIARLEEESVELVETRGAEEAQQSEAKDRIEELRATVAQLSGQISDLHGQVQTERLLKQRLDMEYFKQRLKGRLRPALV